MEISMAYGDGVYTEGMLLTDVCGAWGEYNRQAAMLRTLIDRCEQQEARIERLVTDNETRDRRWIQDIDYIGEQLIIAADNHDLCGIYDSLIERINEKLRYPLASREKEWLVTQTYRVTRVSTITARSAEDAMEIAHVAQNRTDLADRDWEYTDISFIDSEAEEE